MLTELNVNVEHQENYQNYVKDYIYQSSNNQPSFGEAVERLRSLAGSFDTTP